MMERQRETNRENERQTDKRVYELELDRQREKEIHPRTQGDWVRERDRETRVCEWGRDRQREKETPPPPTQGDWLRERQREGEREGKGGREREREREAVDFLGQKSEGDRVPRWQCIGSSRDKIEFLKTFFLYHYRCSKIS